MTLSTRAPTTLKLLMVWPDSWMAQADRALFDLQRAGRVTVTRTSAARLERRLKPGRYHLLLLSPHQFANFDESTQAKICGAVNLILFTPLPGEPRVPEPLQPTGCAALTLLSSRSGAAVAAFTAALIELLTDGVTLHAAVRNAWLRAAPSAEATALSLTAAGEAIWPVPADARPPVAPRPTAETPGAGAAVVIGTAHLGAGDLTVYKNAGDVIHGDRVAGDKVGGDKVGGDKVGGDQVKFARHSDSGRPRLFEIGDDSPAPT